MIKRRRALAWGYDKNRELVEAIAQLTAKQLGLYGSNVNFMQDRGTWVITCAFNLKMMTEVTAIQKRAVSFYDAVKKAANDYGVTFVGNGKKAPLLGTMEFSVLILADIKI